MPWLEERTLTLFVRDTEVRRYEPGVRERGVDVERPSGPLMGSADIDADTDTDPDRALSLKTPIIHGHLIRQHISFFLYSLSFLPFPISPSLPLSLSLSLSSSSFFPSARVLRSSLLRDATRGRSLFVALARAPPSKQRVHVPNATTLNNKRAHQTKRQSYSIACYRPPRVPSSSRVIVVEPIERRRHGDIRNPVNAAEPTEV